MLSYNQERLKTNHSQNKSLSFKHELLLKPFATYFNTHWILAFLMSEFVIYIVMVGYVWLEITAWENSLKLRQAKCFFHNLNFALVFFGIDTNHWAKSRSVSQSEEEYV